MAKLSLAPASDALLALRNAPVDLKGKPNGLRDAVTQFFATAGGEWELRVQLCTDIDKMPIEDAKTVWSEDLSPYVAVARLVAGPQPTWSEARAKAIDDGLAFSPWHGLAAHRPLGSVNRIRRHAYELAHEFRRSRGGEALDEPATLDGLPD